MSVQLLVILLAGSLALDEGTIAKVSSEQITRNGSSAPATPQSPRLRVLVLALLVQSAPERIPIARVLQKN